MNNRKTGDTCETLAAGYLKDLGWQILARNFRSRYAEIDIVARDGRYLVFVEVKHRCRARYGSGLEAVDNKKRRRICSAALYYLRRFRVPADMPVRFDVIAEDGGRLRLVRNAFPFQQ